MNALDRQSDRIADRGLFAGEPDECLHQQHRYSFAIERQRDLQVRASAKQNQSDAVPFAATDEVAGTSLGCRESVHFAIAEFKLLLIHAAREIHCQHQVAT